MKVLVFGMDGNVIDNYSIKAKSAGKAVAQNLKRSFEIEKEEEYFAQIYIETSGKNSLEQFRIAYERVEIQDIPDNVLQQTERDFRSILKQSLENVVLFPDVKRFFERNKGKYKFAVTTTVPVQDIQVIAQNSGLVDYVDIICARHGYYENAVVHEIEDFDKGSLHYNFLLEKFNSVKSDLIAISSTKQDIENAKDFGIQSIAIAHIFTPEELRETEADHVFNSFDDLDELL